MANLINALPQQPSNNSPTATSPAGVDPKEAKLLQEQFAKNLDAAISGSEEEPQVNAENAAELALIAGMAQKQTLPELAKVKTAAVEAQTNLKKLSPQASAQAPQLVKQAPINPQQILNGTDASKGAVVDLPNQKAPAASEATNQKAAQKAAPKLIPSEFQVNPMKKGEMITDLTALATLASAKGAVIEGAGKDSLVPEAEKKVGTHSSNLSTDSFLNLREISQNKNAAQVNAAANSAVNSAVDLKQQMPVAQTLTAAGAIGLPKRDQKDELGKKLDDRLAQVSTGVANGLHQSPSFAKVMDAPITQGSQQNSVLTHDTLNQIANHVSNLNATKQDGEIKLRLKPEHLGELQMSVRASGQHVNIQIKAESEQSKKIIEDSLSSLKDNLKAQNLILGSVEVVTQAQSSQNTGLNMSQPDFASQMNFDQNASSQNNSSQSQSNDQNDFSNKRFAQNESTTPNIAELARARSAAQSSAGRLDMIA